MKKMTSALCFLVLATSALAAEPTEYLNPVVVPLSAKERQALKLATEWPSASSDT